MNICSSLISVGLESIHAMGDLKNKICITSMHRKDIKSNVRSVQSRFVNLISMLYYDVSTVLAWEEMLVNSNEYSR